YFNYHPKAETAITKPENKEHLVSTRNGSRTRMMLPDGTLVFLNAGSELSYKEDFGMMTRSVHLKGEAYFDVTKNAEKPFLINTSTITVRVTGTILNVKSYPDENHSETSLIRGSIEIHANNQPDKRYVLKPKEKLIVMNLPALNRSSAENAVVSEQKANAAISQIGFLSGDSSVVETSWVDNKLIFQNEKLSDL